MNIEITGVVNRNSKTNLSTINLTIDGTNYRTMQPIFKNEIFRDHSFSLCLWKETEKKGMFWPVDTPAELLDDVIGAINGYLKK